MVRGLGGTDDTTVGDFKLFGAPGIAAILKVGASTPMQPARLFEECRILSVTLGGNFAHSFEQCGFHGEDFNPKLATQPPPLDLPRPREEPPEPKHIMQKYEGAIQQGGDGCNEEYELLAPLTVSQLIKRYEETKVGAMIPRSEKP